MRHHFFSNTRTAMCAIAAVAFTLSAFTACENDDTDFSGIINNNGNNHNGNNDEPDYELRDVAFDYTPLSETETVPTDDNDYQENSEFDRTVTITYSDNSATVETDASGINYTTDGAHVTINTTKGRVNYVVSGSTTNGSLKIYSEKKFRLTMNGVSITNTTGAAINNQCHKRMYVVLADNTDNTLTDGTTYNTTAGEDEKGTFFSEGQIIFSGNGTLTVNGNHLNGIASDDYIVFRPGNVINVNCSARNCIRGKDGVSIRGGVLNLSATGNGGKAVNTQANLDISGGRLTAIVSGTTLIEGTDTTGVAALKCDSSFVMTAGQVNIKCTGNDAKGINVNENITISGGQLCVETFGEKVNAAPKAIKADKTAVISGGETYAYSACSSPIDADGGYTIADGLTATYSSDNKLLQIK